MNDFQAKRIASNALSSVAVWSGPGLSFPLYCLEPGDKTAKHPRVPPGTYPLILRTEGGFHQRYGAYYDTHAKFGKGWHRGMIEIDQIPGRDFVLLHVGNYIRDTLGCSLSGMTYGKGVDGNYQVSGSRSAYERAYPIIRDAILAGPTQLRIVAEGAT